MPPMMKGVFLGVVSGVARSLTAAATRPRSSLSETVGFAGWDWFAFGSEGPSAAVAGCAAKAPAAGQRQRESGRGQRRGGASPAVAQGTYHSGLLVWVRVDSMT